GDAAPFVEFEPADPQALVGQEGEVGLHPARGDEVIRLAAPAGGAIGDPSGEALEVARLVPEGRVAGAAGQRGLARAREVADRDRATVAGNLAKRAEHQVEDA